MEFLRKILFDFGNGYLLSSLLKLVYFVLKGLLYSIAYSRGNTVILSNKIPMPRDYRTYLPCSTYPLCHSLHGDYAATTKTWDVLTQIYQLKTFSITLKKEERLFLHNTIDSIRLVISFSKP